MVPTSSPFQRWILEEHVSTVKIPAHITYDGTSDPKDHIASYEGHMYLNLRSKATWCKYFPTTLKGVAQSWITKGLKEGSITGRSHLANKFKSKFSTANRREKTTAELMGLQQAEDESLRDYLTRFSNESSRITSLDQSLAVFALRNDLQAEKFLDFMVMHPPQTLEETLDASDKFIRAEEWNKAKLQSQSGLAKPNGHPAEVPGSRKGKAKISEPPSATEPKKDKAPYLGKFESYTPLTLPRTKIFSATREEGRFKKPKPPPWHQKKGKDHWCEFHKSRGHRTEDCLQLKDQIEELVQKGYLKKYVAECREEKKAERDSRQDLDYHRKRDKPPEGGNHDILTISGGISRNALKRHLRGLTHQIHHAEFQKPRSPVPNMMFTSEDCRGVVYPHDDPLVIMTSIANHNVYRTLVDGGSGANILFRKAFDQLKLESRHLTLVPYPVTGFNGSSSYPDGKILLPVSLGQERARRSIMAEFLVIDAPSVYNVIMGRPLIHDVQGVFSTYHQAMTYVSDEGRSEKILGSQREARECNFLKPSKSRRNDKDDEKEKEKEKERGTKRPKGLSASAQGSPSKRTSLGTGKASSSAGPKDSEEDQPKQGRSADIDSRPEPEEPGSKAMESDEKTESIPLTEGDTEKCVSIGLGLDPSLRVELIQLLRNNRDVHSQHLTCQGLIRTLSLTSLMSTQHVGQLSKRSGIIPLKRTKTSRPK
ncbi:uncharacterized protein LOC110689871 [Chenopodium quinoa]|uniref:uncharacterized protein LOC110689871 n=1 Tax=Chenopodium quinoa TaxID=63459 RepID=UPI000B79A29E|nr:uncharacterized protein LOC110689871 [Chenopodium quinoa]